MGLSSTEILGGLSSVISGNDSLESAPVKEFSNIIGKIIPDKLERKYSRLEELVIRYREIVEKMESNSEGITHESYSEEANKKELASFTKRMKELEKEFIENEKMIASFPYTDLTNERTGLLNKNYNLYTQRINLQNKITNIQFRMNKNIYMMNSINKTSDQLMEEIALIVDEISELLDEIALLSVKNVRLDDLSLNEFQKKDIFSLIDISSRNLSVDEIKEKFMSLNFFVLSYLELKKAEFKLAKKTAQEIESKYKERALIKSDYDSFNILRANKLLIAPIFMSDNILDMFSMQVNNKDKSIQDNNMLSEAFVIMSNLINTRIDDNYSDEMARGTIEKMRELKPTNTSIKSLINNSARNLERLELEEKNKKRL